MYQVLEVSLADLTRLYQYKQQDLFMADFSLKGFDYPWLISSRPWKSGEKVLDVGAAYSPLPIHIQQCYGCEMWVADDFGLKSSDLFWTRNSSPHEHIAKHPEVKYVLERLGIPKESSLPPDYFDVVYSVSALEHVPFALMPSVWQHMDSLLKPGGEMLHAIDIAFPSNAGLHKVLAAIVFDALYILTPQGMRQRHCLATPKAYARLILQTLGVHYQLGKHLSALNMVLDPDVLTEDYRYGLHRINKDQMTDYHYQRVASLLLRMKKA